MADDDALQVFDHKRLAELRGFARLDQFTIRFPLYGGGLSEPALRINFHRGDSVAGVLHFVKGGEHRMLLVEQFRLPAAIDPDSGAPDFADPRKGFLVELVAGKQNPGEPWAETFRREAREETEYDLAETELIASFYPSPGACSEQIHLFYARIETPEDADLPQTDPPDQKGYGDKTEDIRRVVVTPAEFLRRVAENEIVDAKAFAAAEWMRRPDNARRFGLWAGGV